MRGKAGNGDSFGLWRALSCRSNFGFDATDSEEPLLSPRTYNENSAFGKMNPATMSDRLWQRETGRRKSELEKSQKFGNEREELSP